MSSLPSMDTLEAILESLKEEQYKETPTQDLLDIAVKPFEFLGSLSVFILCLNDFNEHNMPGVDDPFMISYPRTGHAWWHHYSTSGLQNVDPVLRFVTSKHQPAIWSKFRENPETIEEKQFWNELKSYGLADGITSVTQHADGFFMWSIAGGAPLLDSGSSFTDIISYMDRLTHNLADHQYRLKPRPEQPTQEDNVVQLRAD